MLNYSRLLLAEDSVTVMICVRDVGCQCYRMMKASESFGLSSVVHAVLTEWNPVSDRVILVLSAIINGSALSHA